MTRELSGNEWNVGIKKLVDFLDFIENEDKNFTASKDELSCVLAVMDEVREFIRIKWFLLENRRKNNDDK